MAYQEGPLRVAQVDVGFLTYCYSTHIESGMHINNHRVQDVYRSGHLI